MHGRSAACRSSRLFWWLRPRLRYGEHHWENSEAGIRARIFISFGIVNVVSALSFVVAGDNPVNMVAVGNLLGVSDETALSVGYALVAAIMVIG